MIVEYLRHIPPGRAAEEIDGEEVLKAIEAQHGIFIERARGVYSFAHLSFQEYFAAKHIVENTAQGIIRKHFTEPRWREVFLLTASLLDDADGFFEHWLAMLAQMAEAEPTMAMLVDWAETENQTRQPGRSDPASWRAGYLFLALSLDIDIHIALDLDLTRLRHHSHPFNLDIVRARELALALTYDLDTDLELNRARTNTYTLDRINTYTRNRINAYTLDRINAYTIDRASARTVTLQAIQGVIGMASLLGLIELQTALESLVLPSDTSSPVEWRTFAREMERVMLEYTPWQGKWLSREQLQGIIEYLEANQFLLACLELAYVSNRQEIKNRMLLLPK
jgi:hypothetical protein